jgi:hypothetical protein
VSTSRWGSRTALILAAMLAACAVLGQKGLLKTPIVVFDFGIPADLAVDEEFDPAAVLRLGIVEGLAATAEYTPMPFRMRSAPVQLALEENRLQLDQIEPPFNTPEGNSWRAVVVAKQLRAPFALAGSIETYQYDVQRRSGSLVVSVDVYNVAENQIMVSAAVTGKAQGTAESDEIAVMAQAIDNAAKAIISEISEPLGIGRRAVLESADAGRRRQIGEGVTRTLFYVSAIGVLLVFLALSRD